MAISEEERIERRRWHGELANEEEADVWREARLLLKMDAIEAWPKESYMSPPAPNSRRRAEISQINMGPDLVHDNTVWWLDRAGDLIRYEDGSLYEVSLKIVQMFRENCERCGKPLTKMNSRRKGLGPECEGAHREEAVTKLLAVLNA